LAGCLAVAATSLLIAPAALAQYYIGPSYLQVPGITGDARVAPYREWVRAEGNYWTKQPTRRGIRGISGKESGMKFTGSQAPEKGPSMLAISIAKTNPALGAMMDKCRSGTAIPELRYAESAEMARHPQEHGPKPADIPDYYEYVLRNVTLTCPVVDAAPEQAFGLHFQQIEWKNASRSPQPIPVTAEPAKLPPAPRTGMTKTFVVSWFAVVADANPNQCPKMNPKPTQEEYYALMSPERAAEQRAKLAAQGGANTWVLPYRGPDEMNVTLLPGIVPDPGFIAPKADVVRGFNLDGDDGTAPASAGIRPHRNFVSPEGEKGIDNQLFTVLGCVAGWRKDGFLPLIGNEQRRAGGLSILVEISGIDDERNDDDVAVTILYSADPMKRDGTSKIVLSDYTYRVNANPEFSQDFARFRGKLVNGVIVTDPLERVTLHEGPASTWTMQKARMRIEFKPDGTISALLGGYRDWRAYVATAFFMSSDYENTIGFDTPGMYNAVRRAADGIRDPLTGEFTGISSAYEIVGVPAFIPREQEQHLATGKPLPVVAAEPAGGKVSGSR
jgi:hypothetical protein